MGIMDAELGDLVERVDADDVLMSINEIRVTYATVHLVFWVCCLDIDIVSL